MIKRCFLESTQKSQVLGLNGSGWEYLQVFFVTRESWGLLRVPRCPFFVWRLATLYAVCRTDHVPILPNFLHVENVYIQYYIHSYRVCLNVLYRIHKAQHFQHVHKAFKNEKLLFLVSRPSIQVFWLYRIVLFSLQKDNLLSFQTLNSSSIPLNASWRDFLAGVNNGINAGIGNSSPECWIHAWNSVDPDMWKLGHRADHMIL